MFSRGANVYNGGSNAATVGGGPQFGPPQGNQNAAAPTPPGLGGQAPPGLGGPMPGQSQPQQPDYSGQLQAQVAQAKAALQASQLKQAKSSAQAGGGGMSGVQNALKRRMDGSLQKNRLAAAASQIRNA